MASTLPKVEIHSDGPNRASITVDGQRLHGVRDLSVNLPIDDVPYVTIEIITTDLTLTGEALLEVSVKDVAAEEELIARIADRVLQRIQTQLRTRL